MTTATTTTTTTATTTTTTTATTTTTHAPRSLSLNVRWPDASLDIKLPRFLRFLAERHRRV
jgi:hypothetical protein